MQEGEIENEENPYTHNQLLGLLDENKIEYIKKHHAPTTTSEESAQVRGSRLEEGAKAMMLRTSGVYILIVFPASEKLDLKKTRGALKIKKLTFASEEEVAKVTNGVKKGGVPPFGSLWKVQTYMDKSLRNVTHIEFNAGLRTASVRMKQSDYELIEKPEVVDIVAEHSTTDS